MPNSFGDVHDEVEGVFSRSRVLLLALMPSRQMGRRSVRSPEALQHPVSSTQASVCYNLTNMYNSSLRERNQPGSSVRVA